MQPPEDSAPGDGDAETTPSGDTQRWIDAVEGELIRYRDQQDTDVLTLEEFYEFSESQLAGQFPENNHARRKFDKSYRTSETRAKSSSSTTKGDIK